MERLAPNNYKVTAYYLPDEEGKPQDVFIFQGDRFIDQVERVETYNRVMAEQTEEDRRKFYHQQKKIREFNTYVDSNMVPALGTMEAERDIGKTGSQADEPEEIEELTAALPDEEPTTVFTDDETEEDILQRAIDMI